MRVLAVNAGSRTLKLAIVDDGVAAAAKELPAERGQVDPGQLGDFARGGYDCSAHRLVHGASAFTAPTVVDDAVRARLGELADMAPLHSAPALAALDAVRALDPDRPAVGCFDSAFHATMPEAARTYAIPWEWTEAHGIRRFGFHGLSHGSAAHRAAELMDRPLEELRLVVCHLGGGASLCAVREGRSVDTTMGFTPLEGLVMATRSGNVDPGVLVWMQRHAGLSADDLDRALEHESGLAGLSGASGDMKELLERAGSGDGRARLAIDVYLHRLRGQIAAMAAAAGGIDALVFTGGVGEHAPEVRAAACEGLAFLGIAIDGAANEAADGDDDVAAADSAVRVLVVAAREDLELARQASAALASQQ